MKASHPYLISVPKVFFRDHYERDLDTPVIVHETARHYVIDAKDANVSELLNDAEHYASNSTDCEPSLRRAAAALIAAIERQRPR